MTGNLNKRGKLLLKSVDKISYASTGSGAFLMSLNRDGLLKIIKNNKVEVLQVLGTRNLNPSIGDPLTLGYYMNNISHVDVVFQAYRNTEKKVPSYPSIL